MGRWIKLHSEVLCDLYSSIYTILLIKSRTMRWIEHMADMGEKREDEMDRAYGRYGGKERG